MNGQEQYHGTLLGADGTPVPIHDEIAKVAAAALDGTTVVSQVAVLNDYPSRWTIGWQRHAQAFSSADALVDYYTPLRALAARSTSSPLPRRWRDTASSWRRRSTASRQRRRRTLPLRAVRRASRAWRAQRDEGRRQQLWPQRQPGPLADVPGAPVAQYYALDKPVQVSGA